MAAAAVGVIVNKPAALKYYTKTEMSGAGSTTITASAQVCDPPATPFSSTQVLELYAGGVANELLIPSSGRASTSAVQSHIANLKQTGIIRPRPTTGQNGETDMAAQVANDTALFTKLQEEQCYYEQRYKQALRTFLTKAATAGAAGGTSAANAEATAALTTTITLNKRLNSVLEVINALTLERVSIVNTNTAAINTANASINTKLSEVQANYDMLSRDNAIILTQREMVRYTEEKNRYTSNQIAVWAAMNVMALATIFYVYRN